MRLLMKGPGMIGIILQAFVFACMLAGLIILPGSANAQATTFSSPSMTQQHLNIDCPPGSVQPLSPKRQLRGVWIATVANIDWPSKQGLSADEQKQQFIAQLNEVQKMNMNAVFVQIRPTADAFYPSQYAPWSEWLTGVQGQNPGYDPLAFMINEAHKRNIEFHAWFNPYRVSMQSDINKLAPANPARQHPDWVIAYGGKLYFNPGLPQVQELITASILEVVQNYDIDGVHFDDYFYPYPIAGQDFPDNATYQQYGASTFANKADWRRDNVNQLIHGLQVRIKQAKSYVKFGISPFGVWRNKATDPTGSDTTAGAQDYDQLYADTRTWIRNEWIDYIAPQIYWNIGFAPAAYDKLVPWWAHEVAGHNVDLYIGQAAYKIHANNAAWDNPEEMPNQLKFNLQYSEVKGSIFFSLKDLLHNPLGIKDRLENDIYRYKALVPVMPWLGGHAPADVLLQHPQQSAQGVQLRWVDVPHNNATYYVVYRMPGDGAQSKCDFENSQYILATVRRVEGESAVQSFVDPTAVAGQSYTYYVTALDRLHNESVPSRGETLTRQ